MPSTRISRLAAVLLAVLSTIIAEARAAEPLPLDEPAVVLDDFTAEPSIAGKAGFFERWRRKHELRDATTPGGIVTDRPSFTYSDSTVPAGWVQFESGFAYASNVVKDTSLDAFAVPELALRIGVTNWLELRAGWSGPLLGTDGYFPGGYRKDYWLTNPQVGFKFQVSRNQGLIPQSALITSVFLPAHGDGWTLPFPSNPLKYNNDATPLLDYIYTWNLSEKFSLGGSTGAVFDARDGYSANDWFQSCIVRYRESPQIELFFEGYVLFGQTRQLAWNGPYYFGSYSGIYSYHPYRTINYTAPYIDLGILWRPSKNVQLDWRLGVGLNEYASDEFTGAGLSFRY